MVQKMHPSFGSTRSGTKIRPKVAAFDEPFQNMISLFWRSLSCDKIIWYSPKSWHGTWKDPLETEKHLYTNHQFWGSMFVFWGVCHHMFSPAKRCSPKYFSRKELFAAIALYVALPLRETLRETIATWDLHPSQKKSTACPDLEIQDMKRILKKKRQRRSGKEGEDRKCVYLVPDWTLCFWGSKFHPPKKRSKFQSTQGSTCWFQVYTVGKNGKAANGWWGELCSRFQTSSFDTLKEVGIFVPYQGCWEKNLGDKRCLRVSFVGLPVLPRKYLNSQETRMSLRARNTSKHLFLGGIGNPKHLLKLGF